MKRIAPEGVATQSANGLMSAADKVKVDERLGAWLHFGTRSDGKTGPVLSIIKE